MEQMRDHHTLHRTRSIDRKSDQMTMALYHWTWKTENHSRIHLAKRNEPGHQLANWQDKMATNVRQRGLCGFTH